MKKIILSTCLLIAGIFSANAQSIHFGVKAGANFSDVDSDFSTSNLTSWHGGAFVEVGLFQNFAIQPEVLYSSQGAKVDGTDDIKLDYINVPVVAKFYLITDKLALEAGPQFGFLVNDNYSNVIDDYKAKNFDFAVLGGLSLNITQNIFVSGRYVVGLTDTTKDADVTNKTIQASVGYRF